MFDVRNMFAALRRPVPSTALARGEAALERGDVATALAEFDAAEGDARDGVARARLANKRGVAHIRGGDRERALAAFALALRYDERCAAALTNVGNLLYEDGHTADAIDHYEAAIRADGAYPLAYQNLGVALKSLGRHGEAVRAMRTATRLAAKRRVSRA